MLEKILWIKIEYYSKIKKSCKMKWKIDEIRKIFIYIAKNPMNKIKIKCNALRNYFEEMNTV